MASMAYAAYVAAIAGRTFTPSGTFRRSESAIARSTMVRVSHGYTCELPPAYDRLGAQRNARLARLAATRKATA